MSETRPASKIWLETREGYVFGPGVYNLLKAIKVKGTLIAANLIGGALFGAGWAIMGYCPGTSVGAVAEGRWHAIWAILGMLVGAAVYAEVYPMLTDNVLTWGDLGKITLPEMLGVSPWLLIPILIAAFIGLFYIFEKNGV